MRYTSRVLFPVLDVGLAACVSQESVNKKGLLSRRKFQFCSVIQYTMFTLLQKYEILSPGERIEGYAGMEKVLKNGMLGIHLSRRLHFATYYFCEGNLQGEKFHAMS